MKRDLAKSLELFKAKESARDIIPLLADEDVQKCVLAWPRVFITIRPPAPTDDCENLSNSTWILLWSLVKWNPKELQEITGIPEAKLMRVFNQAKGNRLIYPDGTVSAKAGKYLENLSLLASARIQSEVVRIVQDSQKRKEI